MAQSPYTQFPVQVPPKHSAKLQPPRGQSKAHVCPALQLHVAGQATVMAGPPPPMPVPAPVPDPPLPALLPPVPLPPVPPPPVLVPPDDPHPTDTPTAAIQNRQAVWSFFDVLGFRSPALLTFMGGLRRCLELAGCFAFQNLNLN
jgi:hypothetical protein